MTITYRSSGTWGSGKGNDLTPLEVDNNFYNIHGRITSVENTKQIPNVISSITSTNNTFKIILTNNTEFGPFTLPTVTFDYKGSWLPSTVYDIGNIVYVGIADVELKSDAGFYYVNELHTSDAVFDSTKKILNTTVYHHISKIQYFNEIETPTFPTSILARTFINYKNDIYLSLEDISPTNAAALDTLILNGKVINLSNISQLEYNDISDLNNYSSNDALKYFKINSQIDNINFSEIALSDFINFPSFIGNSNKVLKVNGGSSGLEFKGFSFLDLNDIKPGFWSYAININKYLKVDSTASYIEPITLPSQNFVTFTDVPQSFTNNANKYLSVNSSETGLEFTSKPTYAFTTLTDTQATFSGSASKYVSVKSDGTGLEFLDGVSGNPKTTLTFQSAQSPSGVSFVEFLNIPNTARRIFILYRNIKTSDNSQYIIQLGNSGGYVTTGYVTQIVYCGQGSPGASNLTTGFGILNGGSANINHGFSTLQLLDSTNRIWAYNNCGCVTTSGSYNTLAGGTKSLGANTDLTKIKILTSGGGTFAAGSLLNLAYE